MEIQKPLISRRMQLRCLSEKDVTDFYVSWLNDPKINKFLELRFYKHSKKSTKKFVRNANASNDTLLLGVFINKGCKHIGNIKIGPINWHHKRADIGLVIGDRKEWCRGYASEAIGLLTNFGFQKLGLYKITAGCYSENKGSLRAFEKAGYQVEARLPSHWLTQKGQQDELLLGVTAKAFFKKNEAPPARQYGFVRRIVFIGGGDLMAEAVQIACKLNYDVIAILAPRHANENLPISGKKTYEAFINLGAKVFIIENIETAKLDQCTGRESLALCFGPAWIFSPKIIKKFGAGMINFNGIPIPHYLGGAHYTWQILNSNKEGGCFLQEITTELDRGNILKAKRFNLPANVDSPRDYFIENHKIGLRFIREALTEFRLNKKFFPIPFHQFDSFRLYFPRLLTRKNGWIDWNWSGREITLFCQAFDDPYIGAATFIKSKLVRLSEVINEKPEIGAKSFHCYASGLIVRKINNVIWIATNDGLIKTNKVTNKNSINIVNTLKEGDRFYTPNSILLQARTFKPSSKNLKKLTE